MNNLYSSALMELFEYIQTSKISSLIDHLIEKWKSRLISFQDPIFDRIIGVYQAMHSISSQDGDGDNMDGNEDDDEQMKEQERASPVSSTTATLQPSLSSETHSPLMGSGESGNGGTGANTNTIGSGSNGVSLGSISNLHSWTEIDNLHHHRGSNDNDKDEDEDDYFSTVEDEDANIASQEGEDNDNDEEIRALMIEEIKAERETPILDSKSLFLSEEDEMRLKKYRK